YMDQRLFLSASIEYSLSFLINILSIKKPCHLFQTSPWFIRWSAMYETLYEFDHLFYHKLPPPLSHLGYWLLT
ncbi:MAG: hypothetical protein EXX96DRAFT_480508, partial [Benjaminiella poitrasii]